MKAFFLISALFIAQLAWAQSPTSAHQEPTSSPTFQEGAVLHQVYFWLKNPDSAEDKARLKEGLATLRGVQEVQWLVTGEPASTLPRDVVVSDWSVSETMYFASSADQDAYQIHPLHQAFVKNY
ncbi:MAG TPA: stress protein, partial [Cryomorphaceae bacterium]|nr:stress protein [Cryomorphaceae bacterium]